MSRLWIGILLLGWSTNLMAPTSQVLTLVKVPSPGPRSVNPLFLAPSSNGKIWFTDPTFHQVGQIDSHDNSLTKFKLTDPDNANNLVNPMSIAEGGDGNGWFTGYIADASGSPLNRSFVWVITPAGTIVKRYPLPSGNGCTAFFGFADCPISFAPDGNSAWIAETEAQKITRVTLTGQFTEFTLNAPGAFPLGVAAAKNGNALVTDRIRSAIWLVTPQGAETEYKISGSAPGILAAPWGIARAFSPEFEHVVFTASGLNKIGEFDPSTGTFILIGLPTPLEQANQIAVGPDGIGNWSGTGVSKIGIFDKSSGQFILDETAVPNGDRPFSIVTLGSNQIAFNALNTNGDWNVYLGTLAAQNCDPPVKITVNAPESLFIGRADYPIQIHVEGAVGAVHPTLAGNVPAGAGTKVDSFFGTPVILVGGLLSGPPGDYTLTVTVTDDRGCTAEITIIIHLVPELPSRRRPSKPH